MKTIFLDTETTGTEAEDRLIQVAYSGEKVVNELFKPTLPIKFEAMATHHITEKMVADKPAFIGSETFNDLKEILPNSVLVAHNAKFDIDMLKKEGIEVPQSICTLKIARYLDPESKLPSYGMQYLRYKLGIEIEATAHDALGDILVLEKLFERLHAKMQTIHGEETALEEMIKVSSFPSLIRTFNFGKHKGKKLEEVVRTDKGYLEWLLSQKMSEEVKDEDWIFTLNHYLA